MKKINSKNEQETFALGVKLGRECRGGEVFALCGELGAGKTKLAQGLAQGLGVKGRVNSPTFNILKMYKTAGLKTVKSKVKVFCHIDAYRLKSADDLETLGVTEFLGSPDTVAAVEWGEKVKSLLPAGTIIIKIEVVSGEKRKLFMF